MNKEDMPLGRILYVIFLPAIIFGFLGWMIPGNILGSDSSDAFIFSTIHDKTYRSRDEVEAARAHDPLHVFGEYLRTNDLLDDVGAEELRATVKREIDDALAAAWEAADPHPSSLLRHVFSEASEAGEGS
jgi:hypothetical protein